MGRVERRVKSFRESRLDWDMTTGQTLKGRRRKYSLTVARVKGRGDGVEKLLDRAGRSLAVNVVILPEPH